MSNQTTQFTDSPKLFLTDWASYNNGTQFEFGHWVDLDDFSDADEFADYITNHFKECDIKSPLDDCGSIREETLFSDYENFPDSFYSESFSPKEMETLFEWINLEADIKKQVEIFQAANGDTMEYCMENYEGMSYVNVDDGWDYMMECNPKLQEISDMNINGVTICEKDYFFDWTSVTVDNETYWVQTH